MAHITAETIISARRNKQNSAPEGISGFKLDDYWIKYGTISLQEVSNQQHAYNNIDPKYGRVPKVHNYFTDDGIDYLVMDYVHGTCLTSHGSKYAGDLLDNIARLIMHVNMLCRTQPGPADGGPQRGLLWGEDLQPTLSTKHDIEQVVRSRLKRDDTVIFDLSNTRFVFTHGDIARRNIIIASHEIYLIDWAFAGYLPRSAEIAALRMQSLTDPDDRDFTIDIERKLLDLYCLSESERLQIDAWQQFCYNNIAHYWPTARERQTIAVVKRKRRPQHYKDKMHDLNMEHWLEDLQLIAHNGRPDLEVSDSTVC